MPTLGSMDTVTQPVDEAASLEQALLQLLEGTVGYGASDLHLRVGSPPFVRLDGAMVRTNSAPLTAAQLERLVLLTSGRAAAVGGCGGDWEYSFEQPELARFRGHVFREGGSWALTLRVIPLKVPTFQELRLPPVTKLLADRTPGLVLITGPTGSGKSTTAAAMLRHLGMTEMVHIITIEDPVEYRFPDVPCCVSQREVGRDTSSYAEGLRSALREDPDTLFLGEIRDFETLEVVLHAAETGHKVIATFHTSTAIKTILRLTAMYHFEDQPTARARLADCLRGIVCQRLIRRRDARGRVLCHEILVNNYATEEAIRDLARTKTLNAILERSNDQGMITFDQHLVTLVRAGLVAADVAVPLATSPADLRRTLNLTTAA